MASLKRCDHCGKETAEKNICPQLRNELHAELDMEFLYPELKKM